ncbi:hypothetical protein TL16_g07650 [Triparma laevis f. inornata]|uniref:Uncharacterized protein n=1 Tax=Triparma laevis f. inornata TaxID=1714386 RepID=A0A9W7B1X9_9STRA|nr:hypothetical protein TL16_g07650 [Triparma laevis f. inornata]
MSKRIDRKITTLFEISARKVSATFTALINSRRITIAQLALNFAALFSIVDLLSDCAMVWEYTRTDKNAKKGVAVICKEALIVLFLIKPGVDVYRVLVKEKNSKDVAVGRHTEMIYVKAIELFTECLLGTLIQAVAFVNGLQSKVAVLSLISSVGTAAFIATCVGIEKDMDAECRRFSPEFYGFVPLESKRWTFIIVTCSYFMFFFQLVSRSFWELGGAYYAFTILIQPLVCCYFGYRYLAYVQDEEVKAKLGTVFFSEQVYGVIAALTVLQMLTFSTFILSIEPQFR